MAITEVAALLGISRSAAYRAVARGEIPTIRIGRRLLARATMENGSHLGVWTHPPAPANGDPPVQRVSRGPGRGAHAPHYARVDHP
jgi:excisionase family DNA binding protein